MKVLTKAQFNEAIAIGKFDIRPTNIVIVGDNKYSLEVSEYENKVTMTKIEEFEEE